MKVLPNEIVYECPRCGETDVDPETHDCGADLPFDGDRCPMCGEPYDSYTYHLQICDP